MIKTPQQETFPPSFPIDPTTHRIYRENLEQQEGTPRAAALAKIQDTEYAVTRLLEAAVTRQATVVLEELACVAYDLLNEAYLLVSPEPTPDQGLVSAN